MIFNFISIILGFSFFFYLFSKFPLIEDEVDQEDRHSKDPLVSIIIPARNEELNLPNLLNDLDNQKYKIDEIICVDDDSTDATAKIIEDSGAKYLNINYLPSGWKGKTWACQNGAKEASGDLLLFVDADVRLSPSAVKLLVKHYKKYGNPISVQPYHNVEKKHEYFSLFFNMIQICSTSLSIYKAKKHVGFYGPVLLISKNLFLKYDGYEAVKNSVIEDFNLGKFYNSKHIVIDLLMGGGKIKFKMYPNSIFEVVEGWSKNFSSGAISIKLSLFVLIFFWLVYLTVLPYEFFRSIVNKNYLLTLFTLLIYILTIFKMNSSLKKIGSYPFIVSIIYPVYLLFFHIVFFYSLFGTYLFKTTKWKGRNMKEDK
ncbi:MAG: glycosyltransferase [Sphaerochaeta sp.]